MTGKEKMAPETAVFFMRKIKEAFEEGHLNTEAEALQMGIDALQQTEWIPCSEPPKESGTYIVTAYDGTEKRVTFVKYQKTLKRWDLTGARSYWHILAYKPLPKPWRGEENG